MDPLNYLDLARQLVTCVQSGDLLVARENGASECRSAISRSYYAAYNYAVDFLDNIGFETENNHTCHTHVRQVLNNCGNLSLRNASTYLDRLHTQRKRADYEMDNRSVETEPNASAQIQVADSIIQKIQNVQSDVANLGVIVSAVLAYLGGGAATSIKRKR